MVKQVVGMSFLPKVCCCILFFQVGFIEANTVMIQTLFPHPDSFIPVGPAVVEAVFGNFEVKKAEAQLWQTIDGKKKTQKLKLKQLEKGGRKWNKASNDLVAGEACYTMKCEFKNGPQKKIETDPVCFAVGSAPTTTTSTTTTTTLPTTTTPETTTTTTTTTSMVTTTTSTTTTTPPPITTTSMELTTQPEIPTTTENAVVTAVIDSAEPPMASTIAATTPMLTTELTTTEPPTTTTTSTTTTTTTPEPPTTTAAVITTAVPVSPLTVDLEVKFKTDKYPTEFRYTVHDLDGNDLITKHSSNSKTGSDKVQILTGNTYCFRGTDNYGDGICCGQGNGEYSVYVDNFLVLFGGEFRYTTGTQCFFVDHDGSATLVDSPATEHCEKKDSNKFNMCVDLVNLSFGTLEKQNSLDDFTDGFLEAKKTWSKVMDGDDGVEHESVSGLIVDDLYIEAAAVKYDGVGQVLAFAGPRELWTDSNGNTRPMTGLMAFDFEDVPSLIERGLLANVIVHEMGHVLGLGTLWGTNNLYEKNGQYLGDNANREYRNILLNSGAKKINGDETVPVEEDGGSGTAFGHWDENCLQTEIMTGWINSENFFSAITVGALADLGYKVDYNQAEAYVIPDRKKCQGARRLRGKTPHSPGWRMLHAENGHREPSDKDMEIAIQAGKKFLKESQEATSGTNTRDWTTREVEVIYQDDSGSIYSVPVSVEDKED